MSETANAGNQSKVVIRYEADAHSTQITIDDG